MELFKKNMGMVKKVIILYALLLLLIVADLIIFVTSCDIKIDPDNYIVYFEKINNINWAGLNYEVSEIKFKDGFKFYITSKNALGIEMRNGEFARVVFYIYKRTFRDIEKICHNHIIGEQFMSPADMANLAFLMQYGFGGQYLIFWDGHFYDEFGRVQK